MNTVQPTVQPYLTHWQSEQFTPEGAQDYIDDMLQHIEQRRRENLGLHAIRPDLETSLECHHLQESIREMKKVQTLAKKNGTACRFDVDCSPHNSGLLRMFRDTIRESALKHEYYMQGRRKVSERHQSEMELRWTDEYNSA